MAIIKCKECGNEISDKAEKCPSCGAPTSTKLGCLSLSFIAIFAFMVIGYAVQYSSPPPPPKTEEQIRKESIHQHFDALNGSHFELTKLVKKSLNDPDSYDHDKTTYIDKGDRLTITTTFRARNEKGGMTTHQVTAEADLKGNILKVINHKKLDRL